MFQLDEELIGQLIYAMEDQRGQFVIHLDSGAIVPAQQAADSGEEGVSYVPIPAWQPIDGFHLMERFLLTLRNPIHRERLRAALAAGRGVFRSFKNALKQSPELERLWFAFKEREMRKVIRGWYDDQRELLGLARLGPEPEPSEELLLEDFIVRPAGAEHREAILALDQAAFAEQHPMEADPPRAQQLYRRERSALPGPLDAASCLLAAETPRGELAGFIWGIEEPRPAGAAPRVRLVQLAVVPAMRGLGIGGLLLDRFLREARLRGAEEVRVELEGAALALRRLFESRGFAVAAETLDLDLARWERGQPG